MKSDFKNQFVDQRLRSLVLAGAILMSSSANVYAQTIPEPATHRVTRAEVMHELEELEAAGYNPARGDDGSYPADVQAAQERVAAVYRSERDAVMSSGQNAQTKPAP